MHKIEGNKLITTTKTKTTITFKKKKKKKTMWTRTTGKIMIMDVDNEHCCRALLIKATLRSFASCVIIEQVLRHAVKWI